MPAIKIRTGIRRRSGQALLIIVLLLFVLVLVASIFIAILIQNLAQTALHSDVLAAQYLAEAGIRFANDRFLNSPDGADWRPPEPPPRVINVPDHQSNKENFRYYDDFERLRGWDGLVEVDPADHRRIKRVLRRGFTIYKHHPNKFLLKVEYNYLPYNYELVEPDDTEDEINRKRQDPRALTTVSKYIRITAIGRAAGSPYVFSVLVAYKPVGITDYIRFVTNKDNTTIPAELGAGFIDLDGNGKFEPLIIDSANNNSEDLPFCRYRGPMRVNGDLLWHGRNIVELYNGSGSDPKTGANRFDTVEISGEVYHRDNNQDQPDIYTARDSTQQIWLDNLSDGVGGEAAVLESTAPNFTTLGGLYRDGLAKHDLLGYPRFIKRLQPPNINIEFYRRLTAEQKGFGIYIDNTADLQFKETRESNYSLYLQKLRDEWLRVPDEFGRLENWRYNVYTPEGAEIFMPYSVSIINNIPQLSFPDYNGDKIPELLIRRHDRPWTSAEIEAYKGTLIDERTCSFNYPDGGVIFAEGNLRIHGGILPYAYYNNTNRYYDLTIVSGGNIYIEGNILTPKNLQPDLNRDGNSDNLDEALNSHPALLAKDSICLNTSSFIISPLTNAVAEVDSPTTQYLTYHWEIAPGMLATEAVTWKINFVEPPSEFLTTEQVAQYQNSLLKLITRHCGEAPGPTSINLYINGKPFNFDDPATADIPADPYLYRFRQIPPNLEDNESMYLSPNYEIASYELMPNADPARHYLNLLYGVDNWLQFSLDNSSERNYWLSAFKIEQFDKDNNLLPGLDIRIEALLYAEGGNWFIIPCEYFDLTALPKIGLPPNPAINPTNHDGTPKSDFELLLERLRRIRYNYRITINGAISENLTTDVASQTEWQDKWTWLHIYQNQTTNILWGNILYNYDDGLHWSKEVLEYYENYNLWLPKHLHRLPKLPVSPALVYIGELL